MLPVKAISTSETWPGHHQCSLGAPAAGQHHPLQKILYNTHCPWISLANLLCASSSRLVTESRDIFSLIFLGSPQAARGAMETGFGDGLGSSADPSMVPVVSAPAPRPPGHGGFIPALSSMSFVRCRLAVCRWLWADLLQCCPGNAQNANSCVLDCACSFSNRQKMISFAASANY